MSPHLPSPAPQTVVRMRSPGEIVSAVPFLLGFVPQDSVVLVGLRGKRVGLTCRLDLADAVCDDAMPMVIQALHRDQATAVILAAFGCDRSVTAPSLVAVRNRLTEAGLGVMEEVSVVDGRWFHETCSDARCCPFDGTPVVDHDLAPSTMALSAATSGYLSSRDDIIAKCAPDRPLLVSAIRAELEHVKAIPEEDDLCEDVLVGDMLAILGWGENGPPTPRQLARAAHLTRVPLIRDVWYAVAAPGMMRDHLPDLAEVHQRVTAAGRAHGDLDQAGILIDGTARDLVLDRLLQWVRNLPDDCPEAAMGPLVIAGMAHWCAGDGAYARTLTDRACRLQTKHLSMLQTLRACIEHGIRDPELGWLAPEFAAASARPGSRGARRRGRRRRGGPNRAA